MIGRLERDSNDPEAQLARQAGAFSGSIPELDEIQGILMQHNAVGASLTGAGMGGAVVCLATLDNVDNLKEAITKHFYSVPHSHFPCGGAVAANENIHVTFPIAGVGHVMLP